MPAVRFFLVPKWLLRAHRALPAHSGRRKLSFVASCRHCMRRVLLSPPAPFASIRPVRFCRNRTDFLRVHGVIVCRRMPPLHATGFIIAARVFCKYTPRPILPSPPDSRRLRAQRFFAAIRRPSGHTPVICPLFCAAFAPNAQCPRGIGRNCARPCHDVPRFYIESVLLKKAGRDKRKPRASGSAEARGSRFRVTTSMEV